MAFKRLFIDIQGDLYDYWNIISIEKAEEYNDTKGEFEFQIVILKNSVNKEAEKKVYVFDDIDERDNLMLDIKEKFKKNPNIYFLGEDDGSMNEDQLNEMGYTGKNKPSGKKPKVEHDGDDESEFED